MSAQEIAAAVVVLAAAGYLVWRRLRRRAAGTCCGERTCPAAKQLAHELERRRSG